MNKDFLIWYLSQYDRRSEEYSEECISILNICRNKKYLSTNLLEILYKIRKSLNCYNFENNDFWKMKENH